MTLRGYTDLLGVTLHTERLELAPVSDEFVQEMFNEFTQEITTYMHPRAPQHIGEIQDFVTASQDGMRMGKELVCSFFRKDTHEFLGNSGLHDIDTPHPELGIWLKKSAHGNKYGREAVAALKQWADQNVDYEYITYPVAKENASSRKIAESLGGVVAKEYEHTNMTGFTWPYVEYHITKL